MAVARLGAMFYARALPVRRALFVQSRGMVVIVVVAQRSRGRGVDRRALAAGVCGGWLLGLHSGRRSTLVALGYSEHQRWDLEGLEGCEDGKTTGMIYPRPSFPSESPDACYIQLTPSRSWESSSGLGPPPKGWASSWAEQSRTQLANHTRRAEAKPSSLTSTRCARIRDNHTTLQPRAWALALAPLNKYLSLLPSGAASASSPPANHRRCTTILPFPAPSPPAWPTAVRPAPPPAFTPAALDCTSLQAHPRTLADAPRPRLLPTKPDWRLVGTHPQLSHSQSHSYSSPSPPKHTCLSPGDSSKLAKPTVTLSRFPLHPILTLADQATQST